MHSKMTIFLMSLNHGEKFKLKKKKSKENWKVFHVIYAYFKVIKVV